MLQAYLILLSLLSPLALKRSAFKDVSQTTHSPLMIFRSLGLLLKDTVFFTGLRLSLAFRMILLRLVITAFVSFSSVGGTDTEL